MFYIQEKSLRDVKKKKENYFSFITSLKILRFALAALSDFCGRGVLVLKISLGHKTRRL